MTEPSQTPATTDRAAALTVLVIGNGGREHALTWAIAADPGVAAVHVAPGNPGTAAIATNHPVNATDPDAVAELATELGVDLVVVGPEAPLVAGVADAVREAGIACFGPSAEAARLEGSKAFAKEVMAAAGVPTAQARVCTTADEAAAALDEFGAPYVVKDDGLAAGKGVVVTDDRRAALAHAEGCFSAGGTGSPSAVVIEEFLDGPEVSLFAISDGTTVRAFQPAQDFKRVGDDDHGPNTGGMGAYTPLDWAPDGLVDEVVATVIQPVVAELTRRGTPFVGLVYAGLALTSRGVRVIEFNARFGDPETQPLLALLRSPLGQVLHAAATGRLAETPPLEFAPGYAVGVVVASEGYPAHPMKGQELPEREMAEHPEVLFFHAGTTRGGAGPLEVSGGRVLAAVATGPTLDHCGDTVYNALTRINFDDCFWRSDIAAKAARGEIKINN